MNFDRNPMESARPKLSESPVIQLIKKYRGEKKKYNHYHQVGFTVDNQIFEMIQEIQNKHDNNKSSAIRACIEYYYKNVILRNKKRRLKNSLIKTPTSNT